MSRARFIRTGGFDVSLRCHEDHDLGTARYYDGRPVRAGRGRVGHARGPHRAGACVSADDRKDGPMCSWCNAIPRCGVWCPGRRTARGPGIASGGLSPSRLGDHGVRVVGATLPLLDRVGALSSWRRVLRIVFRYWYHRGLAEAVGTRDALGRLLDGAGDVMSVSRRRCRSRRRAEVGAP